jgi:hypothetical protein
MITETSTSIPFSLTRDQTQLAEYSCESLKEFDIDYFPPSKLYAS